MKKILFLSSCMLFALQSCEKEDVTTYQADEEAQQTQKIQAKSSQGVSIFVDDFNVQSCSRELGTLGLGSITGGNSAGAFEIPNVGPIFYFLADELGNRVRFRSVDRRIEDDGSFIFRNLAEGSYRVIGVIGTRNALGFRYGRNVPTIESELITVTCGSNPNTNPIARNDSSPATLELGEVRFIDVLANDFDVDGDELSIVSAFGQGISVGPARPGATHEVVLVDNRFRITRVGGTRPGTFFRVNYTISDGRGGFDQGQLRFGAPSPTF